MLPLSVKKIIADRLEGVPGRNAPAESAVSAPSEKVRKELIELVRAQLYAAQKLEVLPVEHLRAIESKILSEVEKIAYTSIDGLVSLTRLELMASLGSSEVEATRRFYRVVRRIQKNRGGNSFEVHINDVEYLRRALCLFKTMERSNKEYCDLGQHIYDEAEAIVAQFEPTSSPQAPLSTSPETPSR